MAEWQFIDAWVLEAVAWGSFPGGSTVTQIIEVADAINHSIPNRDELELTINRLMSASLLTMVGERFLLTDEGNRLREGAPDRPLERVDFLLDRLRGRDVPGDSATWRLEQDEFDAAFHDYDRRFRRLIEKLDAEDRERRPDA